MSSFIAAHGYWILAIGCLVEGETVLLLAVLAARRGLLDPAAVFAIAAVAAFAGNEIFFWVGRRHGHAVLARWPSIAAHAARMRDLIDRHPAISTFAVRFAYGLRTAGPLLIGMSSIGAARFTLTNAVAAIAWTSAIGGVAWLFGAAAQRLLGNVERLEAWLFAAVIAAVAAWRVMAWRRAHSNAARVDRNGPRTLRHARAIAAPPNGSTTPENR